MTKGVSAGDFFFVPGGAAQELEDLRGLIKMPAGRRVLRRLLGVTGLMGVSYGQDGRGTEYNEGLRGVGLWLATKIEAAAPGEVSRLMLESGLDRQAAHSARMDENQH